MRRALVFSGLLGILALAGCLRGWGLDYGIPHPFARPDEEIIVERAFQMVGTGQLDPKFFEYPSLPFYLAAAEMNLYIAWKRARGEYERRFDFLFDAVVRRHGLHFEVVRTASVLFALSTIALTFWLGRRAYGETVGLMAALFLAVAPIDVVFSRFGTVDVTMVFFVTLALVLGLGAARQPTWSRFALTGVAIGLATSAKYNAGIVGLSLALALGILALRRRDGRPGRSYLFGLALAGALAVAVFAMTSPFVLVNLDKLHWALEKHGSGYRRGPDELAFGVHLLKTFPLGLGWPLYAASLGGVVKALRRRSDADVLLLSFLFVFFALVGGVRIVYPRYVLPMVPVMAVLAANLCGALSRRRFGPVLLAAVLGVVSVPAAVRSIGFDRLAAREDTRLLASAWVRENVPRRTRVALCRGYGAPRLNEDPRRGAPYEPVEIACRPDAILSSGARYVITHEHPALDRYSSVPAETRQFLEARADELAELNPFRDREALPFFYPSDAFYLPLSGHDRLERGGPLIRIWKLRDRGSSNALGSAPRRTAASSVTVGSPDSLDGAGGGSPRARAGAARSRARPRSVARKR